MSDPTAKARTVTRVTCIAHHLLGRRVAERFGQLGHQAVMVETARCVRQRVRGRRWGLPGRATSLDDSPMDIFRTTVPPEAAGRVIAALIDAADLHTPGHGMLYAQDVLEYGPTDSPAVDSGDGEPSGLLGDLVLLTCILSIAGSGDRSARLALELGTGVPVVSRGIGTGIRDRLGLLRITIPPQKEIIRLMIPAHDADSIRRLLIEQGRMDRPGGGFLYQTPIRAGLVDPLLRIGRQDHPASIEQIIAAVDDIKGSTFWRKRFDGVGVRPEEEMRRTRRDYREITFACSEGLADDMVRAAMYAGASGATTSRARFLGASETDVGGVAREIGVLCVPATVSDSVVSALYEVALQCDGPGCRIQVLEVPAVFTYQR